MARKPLLPMIGNSHIDPVWLWKSFEGLQEVKSTFMSALDRMRDFPEFIFSASSAAFHAWVERHTPELFDRIREAAARGQWSAVGGWWVEPDCNLPSGESFVRQGLYGQRWFRERLGAPCAVGYNVDSFGHNGALPQILKKAGIDYYVIMRPDSSKLDLPGPVFRWRSPDGSEVIVLRMEGEYTAWTKGSILKNIEATLVAMEKAGLPSMPAFYGVGNHGGGPTIENIKAIRELAGEDDRADYPFAALEPWFRGLDPATLPEFRGSLEGIFPGCFSADSEVKAENGRSERELKRAEALSSLLCLEFGREYPAQMLEEAWKRTLFNQFHDTLAGTSREDARDEAVTEFQACRSAAREIAEAGIQYLAGRIDTRGEGDPLILINLEPFERRSLVEVDVSWVKRRPIRLRNHSGDEQVYQQTAYRITAPDARRRILFDAVVPPLGYAVYRLYQEHPSLKAEPMRYAEGRCTGAALEALFDERVGSIASLKSSAAALETLAGALRFSAYEDRRDAWGAQGACTTCLGDFEARDFRLIEEGALRTVLRSVHERGASRLVVYWCLYSGQKQIRLDCELFNAEKHVQVVLSLKPGFAVDHVDAGLPYGFERRAFSGGQNFAHAYVDLQDPSGAGLCVLTPERYGYRTEDGAFRLILARSMVFARGASADLDPGVEYRCADMGDLRCTLALVPHEAPLPRAEALRMAEALVADLPYLLDCRHEGALPEARRGFLRLEGAGIRLESFKRADDGQGFILRLRETEGAQASATLIRGGTRFPLAFTPHELKTLRYAPESEEARETGLCEADPV